MDALIAQVGSSVDRTAALKALLTWVDLGVLKEQTENTFKLLEVAETVATGAREPRGGERMFFCFVFENIFVGLLLILLYKMPVTTSAVELPSAPSVQQQQAEQMRVYWKVRLDLGHNKLYSEKGPVH